MLGKLWERLFSASYDRNHLAEWIKELDWEELQHFKLNCNGEQVRTHYSAYQNWHYEWQTLSGDERHLTLFQPHESSGEPAAKLEVRGFCGQKLEFSFKDSLKVTPPYLTFAQMLKADKDKASMNTQSKEVLGNMQNLNGEFAEFLIKSLIELVKPVEKKNHSTGLREDESRGLEWIRVGYQLLEQAIDNARENSQQLQEEWTLSFTRGDEGEMEIRLLAFNLDTLLTASPQAPLEVSIYDHKDFKRPIQESSFMGEFEAGSADFIELFSNLLKKLIQHTD